MPPPSYKPKAVLPPPPSKPSVPSKPKTTAPIGGTTTPTKANYAFEINVTPQGHHWVLVARRGKVFYTVTGHFGPNPSTRDGALAEIQKFRDLVATAPVI